MPCYFLARYASHYLCVFCTSHCSTFLLLTFILLFFLDVLQLGIWREANSLADPSLRKIIPDLVNLQLESRASTTVQKYRSGWLKWRGWAASKIGVQVIPAKPLHIALFISELTKISVRNNTGISPIQSVVYSIQWGHNLAGIEECPTSHPHTLLSHP